MSRLSEQNLEMFMRWVAIKLEIIESVLVETGVVEEGVLEGIYNEYTEEGEGSGFNGKSARLVRTK